MLTEKTPVPSFLRLLSPGLYRLTQPIHAHPSPPSPPPRPSQGGWGLGAWIVTALSESPTRAA